MDAPPAQENCKPFVDIARLMAQAGLQVPDILAWDEAQGFMLLTDLGAKTMMEVINPSCPTNWQTLILACICRPSIL